MFYQSYQIYGTREPIYRGSLNVVEVLHILQSYKDKYGVIPTECFISKDYREQIIEFEGQIVTLKPIEHLDFGKEMWIGVDKIEDTDYGHVVNG